MNASIVVSYKLLRSLPVINAFLCSLFYNLLSFLNRC